MRIREPAMMAPPSTARAASEPKHGSWLRWLLLLGGVVLIALFVRKIGPGAVAAQIVRGGRRVPWILVPYAIGTAVAALPFSWLLAPRVRPPLSAIVMGRFAASSANALLPFFGLAGEPSRLLWLETQARPQGLAAIVIDRVLYNSANALLLLAGAATAQFATSLPANLAWSAVGLALLMLAGTGGGLFAAARFGIGRRLQAGLRKFFGSLYGHSGNFGDAVDAALLELVRGPRRALLFGLLCHVAGRAILLLEVPVGLWILGAPTTIAAALVLAVVPIALSVFFSSIPSQVGVQEGAQLLVAAALGLSPPVVLALALLLRSRQVVYALALPWLLVVARPKETQ